MVIATGSIRVIGITRVIRDYIFRIDRVGKVIAIELSRIMEL
jgi:hypothetical protein